MAWGGLAAARCSAFSSPPSPAASALRSSSVARLRNTQKRWAPVAVSPFSGTHQSQAPVSHMLGHILHHMPCAPIHPWVKPTALHHMCVPHAHAAAWPLIVFPFVLHARPLLLTLVLRELGQRPLHLALQHHPAAGQRRLHALQAPQQRKHAQVLRTHAHRRARSARGGGDSVSAK